MSHRRKIPGRRLRAVSHKFRLIWTIAAMLLAAPAALATQDDSPTVGWLLKEIATARGLPAPTEAGAAEALEASGIEIPSLDPAKRLTDHDVVAIGNSLGISTTTQTPDAPFTKSRARLFLNVFRSEISGAGDDQNVTRDGNGNGNGNGASKGKRKGQDGDGDGNGNGNGPPFDPASKGKKKGHNKSPSDPV
jgi:hypothetical protein